MRKMPFAPADLNIEKHRSGGANYAIFRRAASETVNIVRGCPLCSVDRLWAGPETGVYVVLQGFSKRVAPKQPDLEHDVLFPSPN
jgi:hypothetical protein